MEDPKNKERQEEEDFGELLTFTASGFGAGLLLGVLLDHLGFQRSAVGQWLVRTLTGEGESILEGIYALRRRMAGKMGSMAEAYGWGKLFGMMMPWIIDWGSRAAGIDAYGVESFYIPYFYAMSDQIGANLSGLLYLRRQTGSVSAALQRYLKHPVMLTSLAVIFFVPAGLLAARLLGFSPATQVRTSLETIAANLCWLPPLTGWLCQRQRKKNH
jgi:hypothetical protein